MTKQKIEYESRIKRWENLEVISSEGDIGDISTKSLGTK
jgi:hypothetical protein